MRGLRDREGVLRKELDRLDIALADVPDEDAVRCYVERIEQSITVYDEEGNTIAAGNSCNWLAMNNADKRKLVRAVFDGALVDGKPAGVYVSPDSEAAAHRRKKWPFKIHGRLDFELVMESVGR